MQSEPNQFVTKFEFSLPILFYLKDLGHYTSEEGRKKCSSRNVVLKFQKLRQYPGVKYVE